MGRNVVKIWTWRPSGKIEESAESDMATTRNHDPSYNGQRLSPGFKNNKSQRLTPLNLIEHTFLVLSFNSALNRGIPLPLPSSF